MRVKQKENYFEPITLEVTFESKLEMEQLFYILQNDSNKLNSLINEKCETLTANNDEWVNTLCYEIETFL